jgi:hypothetical protein
MKFTLLMIINGVFMHNVNLLLLLVECLHILIGPGPREL